MSNQDSVNPKATKQPTPKFSTFLRAVETERLSPANESSREKPLLLQRRIDSRSASNVTNTHLLQATGILVSAIWLAGAAYYIQRTVGWGNVSSLMPHELGGFLAGILSPIALFWMIAAFVLRSNDVRMYAEALREEVQAMIFPSEEADRRVNNDIERLTRQTAEMSRATKVMLSAIHTAREGLKSEMQALNGTGTEALKRFEELGQTMDARSRDVTIVGEKLEQTIRNIENGTQTTSAWMDKLKIANDQIGAQTAMVNQSTQNTEEAVARLSNLLRDRLQSLGSFHTETESALQRAAEQLTAQRDALRIDAEDVEKRAQNVADALQKGVRHIYDFTDDALDKAKLIETRLQGHGASLENILKLTAAGAQAIEGKTGEAVMRLDRASQDAIGQTAKIETLLSDATANLVAQSLRSVKEARESLLGATEHMSDQVNDIGTRAKTISQSILDDVGRKVADTSAAFVYIQKQIQALGTLFDERRAHLDQSGSQASETADKLQTTLQLALDKVRETSNALQHTITTIDLSVQNAAQAGIQITGLHDQLHGKGQDVALLAGKIAGHLQTVSKELDTQNTTLEQRTAQSAKSLQDLTTLQSGVIGNLTTLEQQTQQTQQWVTTLQQSHIALSEKAAQAENALAQSSDRLIQLSGDALGKISETLSSGDKLVVLQNELQQQFGQSSALAQEAGSQVVSSIQDLQKAKESLQETADLTASNIGRVQQLGQTVHLSLQQLNQAADHFDGTIARNQNSVTTHIQTLGDAVQRMDQASGFAVRLQDNLTQLRDISDGVEEKLMQTITKLLAHNQQIDSSADALVAKISHAQDELLHHGASLKDTGENVLQRLQHATQYIGSKALALEAAAQLAQQQAEELRAQEAKMKRDAFFNSTKFVVESLHSLALDFTRLLDGELPEKTWKAYQKGDTSSFTRRLLNARDEETQNKIKAKFTDDHEFRTYAQRYLRQFEEIYDQAAANDHADLLTTVFVTSDVGKLYKFMCNTLDREARGKDKVAA